MSESPTPTVSQSPTVSASERQRLDVSAARDALDEYIAAASKAANNSFTDARGTLLPLATGQFEADLEEQLTQVEGTGYYTTGSATLEPIATDDYVVDPGTGTVTVSLRVCYDASKVTKFEDGAEQTLEPDVMVRWVTAYKVERAEDSQDWLIASEIMTDRPC